MQAALESGELDAARFQNYRKVGREIRHEAMKTDVRLRMAENRRWRRIMLEQRRRPDKRKAR